MNGAASRSVSRLCANGATRSISAVRCINTSSNPDPTFNTQSTNPRNRDSNYKRKPRSNDPSSSSSSSSSSGGQRKSNYTRKPRVQRDKSRPEWRKDRREAQHTPNFRQTTHTAPPWEKEARFPSMGTKTARPSDTLVPQLTPEETRSVFSDELFVFRCDVINTQVSAAMQQYPKLREYGVLTQNDISNLVRTLHTKFRIDQDKNAILPHIDMIVRDFKENQVAGHPLASVHILSCFKDMEEFGRANEFWMWAVEQDQEFCDGRTYGAAIECFAYQGAPLADMEAMWRQAFDRYSTTTVPSVARETGRGAPLMLLQGIITARLFHGDWRAAYEAFDICVRLYPTLTPGRIYELFIYERPLKEAYIVFLMACRAGCPPKPTVVVPLLKEIWLKTCDARAMMRLVYNYIGAGGKAQPNQLNLLIGAILGSFPKELQRGMPGYDETYKQTMSLVRTLIKAFSNVGVRVSVGTFNTIISLAGKLKRPELIQSALQQMTAAGFHPDEITHRILLTTVGDLGQSLDALKSTWKMMKLHIQNAKGNQWSIHDWRHFLRGAKLTNNLPYFRDELEACRLSLDPDLYRRVLYELEREILGTTAPVPTISTSDTKWDTGKPGMRPATWEEMKMELRRMETIFSSSQVKDFAREPADSLFSLSPSTEPADVESQYPHLLREMYEKLAFVPNKAVVDAEAREGTGTITGYDVDTLRFENWKAVNRLLFEAEVYEKEKEQRMVEMVLKESEGQLVDQEAVKLAEEVKEKGVGWGLTFFNEEEAKRRVRKIQMERREGVEGWRKEEMVLRGMLAKVSPEARTEGRRSQQPEQVEAQKPELKMEEVKPAVAEEAPEQGVWNASAIGQEAAITQTWASEKAREKAERKARKIAEEKEQKKAEKKAKKMKKRGKIALTEVQKLSDSGALLPPTIPVAEVEAERETEIPVLGTVGVTENAPVPKEKPVELRPRLITVQRPVDEEIPDISVDAAVAGLAEHLKQVEEVVGKLEKAVKP